MKMIYLQGLRGGSDMPTIHGKVVDESGTPIPDASIYIDDKLVTATNFDGEYSFEMSSHDIAARGHMLKASWQNNYSLPKKIDASVLHQKYDFTIDTNMYLGEVVLIGNRATKPIPPKAPSKSVQTSPNNEEKISTAKVVMVLGGVGLTCGLLWLLAGKDDKTPVKVTM